MRFVFVPSWSLAMLFFVAGGVSVLGALMIIAIPLPVRMALALLLCAAFAHAAYRHVWRKGKGAICEVAFLSDKDETIQIKLGGKIKRGKIKHSFFCVWLCVVVVSCQKKKYAVMATPYCLPADQHRQLRVLLNYVIGQNATEKSSTMTRLGQTLRAAYDKAYIRIVKNR